MSKISKKELIEIIKKIKSWNSDLLPKSEGPYKAVLADVLNPNGQVNILDKDNVVKMSLLKQIYNSIMGENYIN
jgi:hypothetical protein